MREIPTKFQTSSYQRVQAVINDSVVGDVGCSCEGERSLGSDIPVTGIFAHGQFAHKKIKKTYLTFKPWANSPVTDIPTMKPS